MSPGKILDYVMVSAIAIIAIGYAIAVARQLWVEEGE